MKVEMSYDNMTHVPIFHITDNGDLTVYIAFQGSRQMPRTLWKFEQSCKNQILFKYFGNGLSGITTNILKTGIPLYLNVFCKDELHYFILEEPLDIQTLKYSKQETAGLDETLTSFRNDYILCISEFPSKYLETIGIIYKHCGTVSKGYVSKNPVQCILQNSIELQESKEILREEETKLHSRCPPLFIQGETGLYTFTCVQISQSLHSVLYKRLWFDMFREQDDMKTVETMPKHDTKRVEALLLAAELEHEMK